MNAVVLRGDAAHLPLPDASVDAIVCDPPYGLEFMGREWDGADGFRRSLNEADAGRDSVFGRASRTFPEYKTGKPSGARIRQASEADQTSDRAHNATTSLVARNAPEAYVAGPLFQRWCESWARECLRVLKPGGHLLAFGGTRTWHRLVCGIEDAGFEIRDAAADLTGRDAAGLIWTYGSGFPKSLDVSKAIDKRPGVRLHREFAAHLAERREAAGLARSEVAERVTGARTGACWNWEHHQFPEARWWPALRDLLGLDGKWESVVAEAEREVIGQRATGIGTGGGSVTVIADGENRDITAPATEDAARWTGWGTALKPGWEPIAVARKPLAGRPAINVLEQVELSLRKQGVTGEIAWTSGPASDAARPARRRSSSSTGQRPAAATSAARAAASETPSAGKPSESGSAPSMPNGDTQTLSLWPLPESAATASCGTPSSMPTDASVLAAANSTPTSSPSTTSTAAETGTANQFTARSTPSFDASGSLPATESFAGIATGLTGSLETVRIDRLADGTFAWPKDLPHKVPAGGSSTVAANVLQYGTGALNIDGCRVDSPGPHGTRGRAKFDGFSDGHEVYGDGLHHDKTPENPAGRWPPNVLLSEEAAAEMDRQSGYLVGCGGPKRTDSGDTSMFGIGQPGQTYEREGGGASRFFPVFRYEAKADAAERPKLPDGTAWPTVKPVALIQWLVRLVTPPGGRVLDLFCGTGTTGEACAIEGFDCILIDRDPQALALTKVRLARMIQPALFGLDEAS